MKKDFNQLNVLLLAAGLGTRLNPLTLIHPKPTIPFLNVPMGLYHFNYLNHLNFENLIVNTFHLPDQIKSLYLNQPYYKKNILFSDEKNSILGSGGGIKKAHDVVDPKHNLLVMNADEIIFPKDPFFLNKAYQQHVKNQNLATLVVMKHPEAGKKFGAICTKDHVVVDISKKIKHLDSQAWHFIGVMFLSPNLLQTIDPNIESNIFYDHLIHRLHENTTQIYPIECEWYETGTAVDYFVAQENILKNFPDDLINFINQYDPSHLIKNQKSISLVSNQIYLDESQLTGYNCISKTALVQKNIKIQNSFCFNQKILDLNYFTQTR